MTKFESLCRTLAEQQAAGDTDAKMFMNRWEALDEFDDIFVVPYMVSFDGKLPVTKSMNGRCYVDIFMEKEDAEEYAKNETDCIVFLMGNSGNRIKMLYRNGVEFMIVHWNDTVVGIPFDKRILDKKYNTKDEPARPKLKAIVNMLDYASAQDNQKEIKKLSALLYEEMFNGPLLAFQNARTGEILTDDKDTDGLAVRLYTDVESMTDSNGALVAAERYGKNNCEASMHQVEEIMPPVIKILLNDSYIIAEDAIQYKILTSELAKRAIEYVKKENEKNALDLDGEELLVRLIKYPDMYKEFLTNITPDLEFTGTITASAEGYSGNVIMETATNHNAAATYSILEKLTEYPDEYRRLFATGKLPY